MYRAFRHIAAVLIIFYLFIPVMGFAHVDVPDGGIAEILTIEGLATSPCEHCPCSDEQGSHCCDTTSCTCAFHSPPEQGVQVLYAPVVIINRQADIFWMPQQVYGSIFVPPQNRVHLFFADVIKMKILKYAGSSATLLRNKGVST